MKITKVGSPEQISYWARELVEWRDKGDPRGSSYVLGYYLRLLGHTLTHCWKTPGSDVDAMTMGWEDADGELKYVPE